MRTLQHLTSQHSLMPTVHMLALQTLRMHRHGLLRCLNAKARQKRERCQTDRMLALLQ